MQTQPPDLSTEALGAALVAGWQIVAVSIEYAPVGFGSHHLVRSRGVGSTMVRHRRCCRQGPIRLGELRAALCTAATLRRKAGLAFVGAPIPRRDGGLVEPVGRYAAAVYRTWSKSLNHGDESGWGWSGPAASRAARSNAGRRADCRYR